MRILITGGAGFIGSALLRFLFSETDHELLNFDKLTYASSLSSLPEKIKCSERYELCRGDICDPIQTKKVINRFQPEAIIHLAAESHVDRSIDGPQEFISTNVNGTAILLETVTSYWETLSKNEQSDFRFLHVSTDEVFGSLGAEGKFSEKTPYAPNSPYSASKASSDHLVRAWNHTYGLPTIISNCSNNYGPYQFPEKLIPLMITNALNGKKLPIYGDGQQIRDWLHVDDHVTALYHLLRYGKVGESYAVGGNNERANLDVVASICQILDSILPSLNGDSYYSLIEFVEDRPGHDQRYAIDASKIYNELGWKPRENFDSGLAKTITWYVENRDWCEAIKLNNYDEQRVSSR